MPVSRPVKVFCWLGWKDPSTVRGPTATSAAWPNLGRGRGTGSPLPGQRRQQRLPREGAQGDGHPQPGEDQLELPVQPRRAGVALGRRRLVVRRRAPHRGHHPGADQGLAVADVRARRQDGEPDAVQRGEEPVAAAVAGEDAAGPVAAVRGRGQARRPGRPAARLPSRGSAGPSRSRRRRPGASRGRPARARRPAAGRPGTRSRPSSRWRRSGDLRAYACTSSGPCDATGDVTAARAALRAGT